MGPLTIEANAAGGCAEKKARGEHCGGHYSSNPDNRVGGSRMVTHSLFDGAREYRFTLSICEWGNLRRYHEAAWIPSKVAWERCPNKTLEESKAAATNRFPPLGP